MNIKHVFILAAILILTLFSCKKEAEQEFQDVYGDIIYTDSFSPEEWENPGVRKKIEALDKDIGKFIKSDIVDPNLRKTLKLIEKFINLIHRRKFSEIEQICTPSAYNSFNLRFPDVILDATYDLRVAYPGESIQPRNQPEEQTTTRKWDKWIKFKILYANKTLLSSVEVDRSAETYIISDFDNKFFNDIDRLFNDSTSDNVEAETDERLDPKSDFETDTIDEEASKPVYEEPESPETVEGFEIDEAKPVEETDEKAPDNPFGGGDSNKKLFE